MEVLAKEFAWPVVVLILGGLALYLFRDALGDRIRGIRTIKTQGRDMYIRFDPAKDNPTKPTPQPGDKIITPSDVIEAFKKIPNLSDQAIQETADKATCDLLDHQIVTRDQLTALTTSKPVIDTLSRIYVDELRRPAEAPLDPLAIANWGAALYRYGTSSEVEQAVRDAIRQSEEYKNKHGIDIVTRSA